MKAKQLAKLLLKTPEATVKLMDFDGDLLDITSVAYDEDNHLFGDIIICDQETAEAFSN